MIRALAARVRELVTAPLATERWALLRQRTVARLQELIGWTSRFLKSNTGRSRHAHQQPVAPPCVWTVRADVVRVAMAITNRIIAALKLTLLPITLCRIMILQQDGLKCQRRGADSCGACSHRHETSIKARLFWWKSEQVRLWLFMKDCPSIKNKWWHRNSCRGCQNSPKRRVIKTRTVLTIILLSIIRQNGIKIVNNTLLYADARVKRVGNWRWVFHKFLICVKTIVAWNYLEVLKNGLLYWIRKPGYFITGYDFSRALLLYVIKFSTLICDWL